MLCSQKSSPELSPSSAKGENSKKGAEKRPEYPAWDGFPCANSLCPLEWSHRKRPFPQEWLEYGWRTQMDQNGPLQPKWTILVHFGLANAKTQFGIRPFDQDGRLDHFGPMVQYTFRQYRSHSLFPSTSRPTLNNLNGAFWSCTWSRICDCDPRSAIPIQWSLAIPIPSQWARRDRLMSRGKNCRETIFVSHLSRNYPHRGVNFERG